MHNESVRYLFEKEIIRQCYSGLDSGLSTVTTTKDSSAVIKNVHN